MLTRTGLCVIMIFSLAYGSGAAAGAPAPPPGPGGVRIEFLSHNVTTPLTVGDRLMVTLRGSAGGTARFHIFGVITDVEMREIRSGAYQAFPALYIGTYNVRPGDTARNAAVFATLIVRGREVVASSDRPITIDSRPPAIMSRHPGPGVRLTNIRPNVVVTYHDETSGVNPGSVRLIVRGREVSARAAVSETSVSYNPDTPFPPGPVRVQLTLADRAKNAQRVEWTFLVAPANDLIKSVTINPATPLISGDILTVVMTGVPGGRASFAVAGLTGAVPMRESRTQGLYFGSFAARPGQSALQAPLVVTLSKAGRKATAAAAAGVTILPAAPPAPTILAPDRTILPGERGVARMVLRGRTRAGFRILGRISFANRSPSTNNQGSLGEFATMGGVDGTWRVTFGPLISLNGARLVVTIVAIDPAGQRSLPAAIEVAP